jgi:hypothetical protein
MSERPSAGAKQILDQLSALTAAVCQAVTGERLDQAADLLAERGRLIRTLETLRKEGGFAAGRRDEQGAGAPGQMPRLLREMDEQMMTALTAQRKRTLERLEEAGRRKAIKVYER